MSEPGSHDAPDDTLVDLLIKQITEGLSPAEQRGLDAMDGPLSGDTLRDLERAAAAVTLAATAVPEALPPALKERLYQSARTQAAALSVRDFATRPARATVSATTSAATSRSSRSATLGWWAAAACLLLAVFGWLRPGAVPTGPTVADVTAPRVAPPSPSSERGELLQKTDAQRITLGATKEPAAAGLTGDVVWDPATQKGYMRLSGLQPNDPHERQYQIWIFDGERDQRYPVDGGVFDMPAGATEVVIPIRARLAVRKAAAFAVTVETPGGVVVSSREHVVALGAAASPG